MMVGTWTSRRQSEYFIQSLLNQ